MVAKKKDLVGFFTITRQTMSNSRHKGDPFLAKVLDRVDKLQDKWMSSAVNSSEEFTETYLIELIIRSTFTLDDSQFQSLLNLSSTNKRHLSIYVTLKSHVVFMAKFLYGNTGFSSLSDFPLSNLKLTCYHLADRFYPLFYIPIYLERIIETRQRDSDSDEATDTWEVRSSSTGFVDQEKPLRVLQMVEKFNQMWVLALMLRQEYNALIGLRNRRQ